MKHVAKENIQQLKDLLSKIKQNDYQRTPGILSGASVGQHIRHILEFYLLLVNGSSDRIISYDKRKRDVRLETDISFALTTADNLVTEIETLNLSDKIKLDADYTSLGESPNLIESTLARELAYCIEHSIHHQAIIKAALLTMRLRELTDENFGVAYSTIRYRNNLCVQ